jgi:hypothetical protein
LLGVPPKAFEIIQSPGAIQEDVDQVIAVIHQDPLGVPVAFNTHGRVPKFFQIELNSVADRLVLASTGAGADDKEIGKTGYVAKIEDADVLGLLFFRGVHGTQPKRVVRRRRDGSGRLGFRDRETSSCPYSTTIKEVRRIFFLLAFLPGFLVSLPAQLLPSVAGAKAEVERMRALVEAGALPRLKLEEAQELLADTEDDDILRHSLYGNIGLETLTEDQATHMVDAARRQLARQQARVDKAMKLVDEGVTSMHSVDQAQEDLQARRTTLDLAENRAHLLQEMSAMAQAEAAAHARMHAEADHSADDYRLAVQYEGSGQFSDNDLRRVVLAFEKRFSAPLPISARGETALHKTLGFDHRGRVDVALNPDQVEGIWLRRYLESEQIPYFAFRSAIAGSATGPHIHLGPPSTRLMSSD